jgi:hypothetical protein
MKNPVPWERGWTELPKNEMLVEEDGAMLCQGAEEGSEVD